MDSNIQTEYFSVDAALLRELGERLVGKAHIALAELVKNAYDADATVATIKFGVDTIEVIDNGHGMDVDEFKRFWMRIGGRQKERQAVSRCLKRPLTGSKGVGRLSIQFLAHKMELFTVSDKAPNTELVAWVDWDQSVTSDLLTEVAIRYRRQSVSSPEFLEGGTGVKLVLTELKQSWTEESFRELARALWPLKPPFFPNPDLANDRQRNFAIDVRSEYSTFVESFDRQMTAFLDLYQARIIGKLRGDSIQLQVAFRDGKLVTWTYPIQGDVRLSDLSFDIRVFNLAHRQRYGISVEEARQYLTRFGGVHIYDAGFHLPHYGADTDWLGIERDHSHRLFVSKLLPQELYPKGTQGLRFLPTNNRVFGVVHVNTSQENRSVDNTANSLTISVTRDRLVENNAYATLQSTVRYALDYYAYEEAKRQFEDKAATATVMPSSEAVPSRFRSLEEVLAAHRDELPEPIFQEIDTALHEAVVAREQEAEKSEGYMALLGALATAGISAVAYEHEVIRQFQTVHDVAESLRRLSVGTIETQQSLCTYADVLDNAVDRAREVRALFSPLMDQENRETRARFRAREIIEMVANQMGILMRGISVDLEHIDGEIRLPEATYAQWSAIFQNVFINAVNAMLDTSAKRIAVSSPSLHGQLREILIEDTGVGVDLKNAESLFQPFVRKVRISHERRALGMGGTGLGLTIVRMIASTAHCNVGFVAPSPGFKTAFRLSWREEA